jgi:hypothetical protein
MFGKDAIYLVLLQAECFIGYERGGHAAMSLKVVAQAELRGAGLELASGHAKCRGQPATAIAPKVEG